jgi:hypothetical protein
MLKVIPKKILWYAVVDIVEQIAIDRAGWNYLAQRGVNVAANILGLPS